MSNIVLKQILKKSVIMAKYPLLYSRWSLKIIISYRLKNILKHFMFTVLKKIFLKLL